MFHSRSRFVKCSELTSGPVKNEIIVTWNQSGDVADPPDMDVIYAVIIHKIGGGPKQMFGQEHRRVVQNLNQFHLPALKYAIAGKVSTESL
jgi:hypothetical protein